MRNILLIDFGSTYTKITAVDAERAEIIATARGITTVETDIMEGLNQALTNLERTTGKIKFDSVLGCSSAAGGLKMVAIGLVPELTAEAAKRAVLGAGAKVLGVYCNALSEYELAEINKLQPDILLLSGGTDGGNNQVIIHNAEMLTGLTKDIPVIVAGNKSVAPQVVKILAAKLSEVVHTANVMPALNHLDIEPARETIRQVFLRKIVRAKGLDKANCFVNRLVMPTPAAVLKAAELLSRGTDCQPGLGDLMVVDIGGATTDIYSLAAGEPQGIDIFLRGLPEPFAKRTVEGDLGMRYSATALLNATGARQLAEAAQVSEDQVTAYAAKVEAEVEYLPVDEAEVRIEMAMGRACVKLGADRHVGILEKYLTAGGTAFAQTGKDLTQVKTVIGTGGVIINNAQPQQILAGIVYDSRTPYVLRPKQPQFQIDQHYILAAMGLLSELDADTALRMMKKYIIRREE